MPLTRCLHNALQDDDNLKLLVHKRALGQIEERALGIDLVANGEGRDQEELVSPCSKAHVQFTLVQRQELALWGLSRLVRDIIIIKVIIFIHFTLNTSILDYAFQYPRQITVGTINLKIKDGMKWRWKLKKEIERRMSPCICTIFLLYK